MAALTVKFQIRMTEDERKMLEEITKQHYPEYEHAHSMMLRRLIRREYNRERWKRGQEEDERDMQRIANEWAAYDRDPPGS